MSRSKRVRTETSSLASMAIRSAWERSAPLRRIARSNCARVCRSLRLRPAAGPSTRRLSSWSGAWRCMACWSIASGARATAGTGAKIETQTRSSSSRRSPTIGRRRRNSTRPTCSCCRGSHICAGAATTWCWSCRDQARCSGFAIRRLPPPSRRCRRRNRSSGCAGRTVFPASSCSPCWSNAEFCSSSTRPATAGCGPTRATTVSCSGTFTIFCFTRAARKAGTPTRWAASIPMPA